MDPIGSDDEIVGARRTISEGYVDFAIPLTERCHGGAEPPRDAVRSVEQNAMKLIASNANAGADATPELWQPDLRQLSSLMTQDSLMGHANGPGEHGIGKAKAPKRANAVPGNIEAGTARGPGRRTLDDFRKLALSQGSTKCEARDSATDNQDA